MPTAASIARASFSVVPRRGMVLLSGDDCADLVLLAVLRDAQQHAGEVGVGADGVELGDQVAGLELRQVVPDAAIAEVTIGVVVGRPVEVGVEDLRRHLVTILEGPPLMVGGDGCRHMLASSDFTTSSPV